MNSLRFLLVHNDLGQSERISAVLEGANHTVLPTPNLDEATDALSIEQFDAVLVGSPLAADGLADFKTKLRQVEESQRSLSHIPVLSLAGAHESTSVGDAWDGYFEEPFDPWVLTEAVVRLAQAVSVSPNRSGETQLGESQSTEGQPDGLPVLVVDEFKEQVGFDRELMVEIIELFLEERQQQVEEMRDSLETEDLALLSRLAHTIKGSLGSLHAVRARAQSQELELAARAGNLAVCRRSFAALEDDLAVLEPELLALRDASR